MLLKLTHFDRLRSSHASAVTKNTVYASCVHALQSYPAEVEDMESIFDFHARHLIRCS